MTLENNFMENPGNPKINITFKEKPEIKIPKKDSLEILITQKITDTLKIENINPLNRDKFNVILQKREDIKRIVELPLLEACELFWDKNIKTVESSANKENIQSGHGWILLDWESLSDENKQIAQSQNGLVRKAHGGSETLFYDLEIPMSKDMLVKDISKSAAELANKFQKQKITWASGITLEKRIAQIEKQRLIYKKSDPESFNREIERLKQPGVFESECEGYFDTKTQACWDSEELFKKSLENSELVIENKELKNKYSQELIDFVWKRLEQEGITNADDIIGTRKTIENEDFDKFWNSVKNEDVKNLVASYEQSKKQQLQDFEKYQGKYNEGDFVSEIGVMISQDTSWWDNKINKLNLLLK